MLKDLVKCDFPDLKNVDCEGCSRDWNCEKQEFVILKFSTFNNATPDDLEVMLLNMTVYDMTQYYLVEPKHRVSKLPEDSDWEVYAYCYGIKNALTFISVETSNIHQRYVGNNEKKQ